MGPYPSSKAIRDPTVAATAPGGPQEPDRPHRSCFTIWSCRQYVAVHRSTVALQVSACTLESHSPQRLPRASPVRARCSTAALQAPPHTFEPHSPEHLQQLFRSADHAANPPAHPSDLRRLPYGGHSSRDHSSRDHTAQLRIRWEASPPT
ncbi:hypothetical protein NDU88_003070 [Pleurodeles waltl]|uniref:Uncharacterized protein n=1 Tax=Pleurodeles waltl TaxID=8319 RepID=A0AAV7UF31_PLEWA|nr:hypothetical protein NDU88_003070 [Pleurodeles waltl]